MCLKGSEKRMILRNGMINFGTDGTDKKCICPMYLAHCILLRLLGLSAFGTDGTDVSYKINK